MKITIKKKVTTIKKVAGIFLGALFIILLVSCKETNMDKKDINNEKETSQSAESSEHKTSKSTTKTSKQADSSMSSSTIDDVRKVNPETDVSNLRRQLYEAGVNSSALSDEELEKYAQEAEKKQRDFIEYVKEKLE